jgi:RNA-directed DNA polymerase
MNIGEMQRKLSAWAEQDKERKFYGLYNLICDMDWLRLAHAYVEQNAGSKTAGCDGIDMSEFNQNLEVNLLNLMNSLQTETFVASPARRVYIPKTNGKVRPLGIPTIRDRIVQEAIRMVLEPIFEADFSQYSFGFRPNRCTMDAIKSIQFYAQEGMKFFWIIEGDISSYFDTINHRKLMQLLGKRINDRKLLNLIWKFLRSGVMERKLFKDTKLGTPQGGIISPLLANVYLHELDMYMKRYTDLTMKEKKARRKSGRANFAYVRYADDFVILSNGSKENATELREEICNFLSKSLRLTLSMEKTRVTHLEDGFDFLGFTVKRCMGNTKMGTKILVSAKSMKKHLEKIQSATSPDTHEDSVIAKVKALNRIIAGWCRYFQYTSKVSAQFRKLGHKTFWCVAHWLGRKFQLTMPQIMKNYYRGNSLGDGETFLIRHSSFTAQRYAKRFLKPNPYTTQECLEREELLNDNPWLGIEVRPGMSDLNQAVKDRDNYTCTVCGDSVTDETAHVDHILPYSYYKRPVDANKMKNLHTLCIRCHKEKTERDRQMESRMQ